MKNLGETLDARGQGKIFTNLKEKLQVFCFLCPSHTPVRMRIGNYQKYSLCQQQIDLYTYILYITKHCVLILIKELSLTYTIDLLSCIHRFRPTFHPFCVAKGLALQSSLV